MTGTLLVTPEKLQSTAEEFSGSASTVQGITNSMIELVTSMGNTWIGDAASAFINRFNQLKTDMDEMFKMITEHCTDLNEMAANYNAAEDSIISATNALNTDAIQY